MEHQVFINSDDFIEVHIIGNTTPTGLVEVGKKMLHLITVLEDEGKKANILLDYTQRSDAEELGVAMSKAISKSLKFNKAAGFGANEITTKVVQEVTKANRIEDKVRLFATRAEAEAWLKE